MPSVRSSFFNATFLIVSLTFSGTLARSATPASTQPPASATSVATSSSGATTIEEAHGIWLTGAQAAAAAHGCTNTIEQKFGDTIAATIEVFGMKAVEGSCLLLQPITETLVPGRYSFAWGGQVNGIDIVYISDVGKVRIWNNVEVPVN